MTDKGGLYYIHERIDQLIRQTALEVALLRLRTGMDEGRAQYTTELTLQRFWAADDAAGETHGKEPRAR